MISGQDLRNLRRRKSSGFWHSRFCEWWTEKHPDRILMPLKIDLIRFTSLICVLLCWDDIKLRRQTWVVSTKNQWLRRSSKDSRKCHRKTIECTISHSITAIKRRKKMYVCKVRRTSTLRCVCATWEPVLPWLKTAQRSILFPSTVLWRQLWEFRPGKQKNTLRCRI